MTSLFVEGAPNWIEENDKFAVLRTIEYWKDSAILVPDTFFIIGNVHYSVHYNSADLRYLKSELRDRI